jgi:hypothetical protein
VGVGTVAAEVRSVVEQGVGVVETVTAVLETG